MTDKLKCGRCNKASNTEVCEECMNIMLLGESDKAFMTDENFYKEIGVIKDDR